MQIYSMYRFYLVEKRGKKKLKCCLIPKKDAAMFEVERKLEILKSLSKELEKIDNVLDITTALLAKWHTLVIPDAAEKDISKYAKIIEKKFGAMEETRARIRSALKIKTVIKKKQRVLESCICENLVMEK